METKKKIYFLLYSMNVGGVEKSLLNLISVLPREQFDIHIGLVHPKGDFLKSLPSDVTIHEVTEIAEHWHELKNPPIETIRMFVESGRWIKAMIALCIYVFCKLQGSFYWWVDYILKDTKGLAEEFDIAIAYAGPTTDIDYYVCKKISAKNKIGWIHFDIDKVGYDARLINNLYQHYKKIIVVSDSCRHKFAHSFPKFEDKMMTFNNVISPQILQMQADNGKTFEKKINAKSILTVGRVSREKGQIVALDALKLLINKGYDVVWYFIGDGSDREVCDNKVVHDGLEGRAVFLGALTNPYGYMRDCDVYVQPSRYEGYCVTILEALCFGAPIVATNFTSVDEQLKGRENGFVVGMDAEAIASGIEKALSAPKTEKVREMDNSDVEKLLSLL